LSIKPQQEKDQYLKSLNNVSKEAKIIKMADRIDNLLEMNETNWSNKRKVKYAKDGKIILEGCGNANKELSLKLKHVINTILSRLKP